MRGRRVSSLPASRPLAWLLLWMAGTGAWYEWGGAAARGVREIREGRHREARESLRKGREELPRSAAVRYDQALAFQGAGLIDSARTAYRDVLTSSTLRGDPARAAAAYNLGNEAMRAEQFHAAAALYRESLRIDPARVDAKKNMEEAIRRARAEPPKPPVGGSGGGADGRTPPGSGPPASTPPGTGPSPERPNQPPGSAGREEPRLGGKIPSRAEAEHWLDALEAERKAARLRERGGPEKEPGQRDW